MGFAREINPTIKVVPVRSVENLQAMMEFQLRESLDFQICIGQSGAKMQQAHFLNTIELISSRQGLHGTIEKLQCAHVRFVVFFLSGTRLSFFPSAEMAVHVLFRFGEHMMLDYAQVDCSIVNLAAQTLPAYTYTLTG